MFTATHDDYKLIDGSVFFDRAWYLATYEDVSHANCDPIEHYLNQGASEERDPSPFFSTKSYLALRPDVARSNINPLVHFLRHGITEIHDDGSEYSLVRKSGLFDEKWYLEKYPDIRHSGFDPLWHYLAHGAFEGRDPSELFESSWYLEARPDVAAVRMNPLVHYIAAGRAEGVLPKPDSWSSLQRQNVVLPRFGRTISRSKDRKKVFFVTHEATRTGAPLIIKTLLSHFALNADLELFTFCLSGGDIFDDFRLYSHVIDCTKIDLMQGSIGIGDLISDLGSNVVLAICNTANVNHYSSHFKEGGIPIITLVHEMLYMYDHNYVRALYDTSNKVIFPAKFVQSVADARVPLPPGKAIVSPQGLLDRSFGSKVGAKVRADIRRELGLPEDSIIVIGCGTVNIRKGVDLFVSVAERCFELANTNTFFVWLGSRTTDAGFDYWTSKDIEASGLSDRVILVGERADPAPYYKAADIFALTSREDPFPCVVHEAMACELPVVAFEGAGGAPEALDGGCGISVPYRDTDAMATAIVSLSVDKEARCAMGAAARARVGERYDFQAYFSSIAKLAQDELEVSFGEIHAGRPKTDRPRVLFFNRDWWISGVNSFAETLIKGLIKRGVDVELIFPEFPPGDIDYLPDVPHRFLRLEGMPLDRQWQVLREFCEQQSPCILVPNYDYVTSAISPSLSSKVGLLGILHSDDVEHYDHANRLGRYWNRIVCSTQYLAGNLSEINPQFSEKVTVIPYGIPVPATIVRKSAAASLPLRIVYCARLMQHQKRVLDLIKVTNELDRTSTPYRLTVIGEGSEAPALEAAWQRQIADGSIVMTGRLSRERMLAEFEQNDVFLLVSEFEGMPISLLEAMARGVVPVVSDIPAGIPELVLQGKTGFVAGVGNAKEFAGHLQTLSRDRELLARLSEASYSHVKNNGFTDDAMSSSYLDLIEEMWTDIVGGSYQRPRSISWRNPGGDVSPPGFVLKLTDG